MNKILIIDDEEAALFGYRRFLSKEGFEIETALSLQDAQSKLSENRFNFVILDIRLPDGNALNLLPEIRSSNPNAHIFIASGVEEIHMRTAAKMHGVKEFLVKPVQLKELSATLHAIIAGEKDSRACAQRAS